MITCGAIVEQIVQSKQSIIAILAAHGVAVSEDTKLSSLPTLASKLVSDVDMLNANGLSFGSNSILVEADAPVCPTLSPSGPVSSTFGGRCHEIKIHKADLIKVLKTKGISIPNETLLSDIVEYASKIRSKANIPNAQNKYFGSSDDTTAIVGKAIVGRAIVGMK